VRRHGRSRAFAANQSSNAATSFEFLVFSFEFKNLLNREIHEMREKEMRKIPSPIKSCQPRPNEPYSPHEVEFLCPD
jgi:amino acid permease